MAEEFLTPWLIEKVRDGHAVLFLGAGASKGAIHPEGKRVPDGAQLRDYISDRFLGGALKDKPLAQVAEIAKNESSLHEVQTAIRDLFLPFLPAEFHKTISLFRWHAIITTNYDLLIERAYEDQAGRLQRLAPIIQDGDRFDEKLRDPQAVPFLKLHGCINHLADPGLPLILATEEYAKHRNNRERLFQHFQEWAREHPVIFCGYDVSDPNIQQILFDLSDMNLNRPMYGLVKPDLSDFDIRYWSARRFKPIKATFEEFLKSLDSSIPEPSRQVAILLNSSASPIQRWVQSGQPTESLLLYLENEMEQVRDSMPLTGSTAEDFYRGRSDSWSPIASNLDVPRRISDDLIIEVILEEPESSTPRFFVIKGYAGSGKSVTLRRFAWDASCNHESLVFWLKEGGYVKPDLIRELYNLTKTRFTVVIEDVLSHASDVERLLTLARRERIPVNVVGGSRSNEWYAATHSLDKFVTKEYELRDLSEREIEALLCKLEEHKCLGHLAGLSTDEQKNLFRLSSERQLLVALHEATSGKPLEEILLDEYRNIVPREAQEIYLDICTLHRFRVGVRAGLLSRVSGVNLQQFGDRLLKPLHHVVFVYFDASSRDYAYRTRHPIIGDLVFRRVIDDQEKRASQIIRIVRCMNVDYESDRHAFEELVRGRDLADLFSDRIFADRIFQAALESTASVSHIEHQRAVFELNHPGGNASRAIEALRKAEDDLGHSTSAILHTKAMALRRLASNSSSDLEREKYRSSAKEILHQQIRKGNKPHPYHTLGQIYLDEINERLSEMRDAEGADSDIKERIIGNLVGDLELVVTEGLQSYPDEPYLLSLESELASILDDKPRALDALRRAVAMNPGNDASAVRLSRQLLRKGGREEAERILRGCLEANPTSKVVRFELAKILIEDDEALHNEEIRRLLRGSFSDGDRNIDAQFWFARHEFVYGDKQVGRKVFNDLASARVPPGIRNKVRGIVRQSGGKPMKCAGIPKNITESFCFVSCPELGDDVFLHYSECKDDSWEKVSAHSRVEFEVGFSLRGPVAVNVELAK